MKDEYYLRKNIPQVIFRFSIEDFGHDRKKRKILLPILPDTIN